MREITATSQIPFYSNSIPKYKTEVPAHHTQMSVELDCYHDYSFEITAVNEMGAAAKVSKFDIPKVASGKLYFHSNTPLCFLQVPCEENLQTHSRRTDKGDN